MLTHPVGSCAPVPLQLQMLLLRLCSIIALSGITPEVPWDLFQVCLAGIAMHSNVRSLLVASFPTPTSVTEL